MIAATITKPKGTAARPGLRFGLIDNALAPLNDTLGVTDPAAVAQLKLGLAVIASAEALFTLTDLYNLEPEAAVEGIVRTAASFTRAALAPRAGA
jgi:hypothetical protein